MNLRRRPQSSEILRTQNRSLKGVVHPMPPPAKVSIRGRKRRRSPTENEPLSKRTKFSKYAKCRQLNREIVENKIVSAQQQLASYEICEARQRLQINNTTDELHNQKLTEPDISSTGLYNAVNENEASFMVCSNSEPRRRRQARSLPIEEKLNLLHSLKAGVSELELSREYDISQSGIRAISYMKSNELKKLQLERDLYLWCENYVLSTCSLELPAVLLKAQEICVRLLQQGNELLDFWPNMVWCAHFCKRYKLNTFFKVHGQESRESIKWKIRSDGYLPQQVFSAAQFSLTWKCLPDRTSIRRVKCFPNANTRGQDQICLLLCGNAFGNLVIRPMLIYPRRTPFEIRVNDLLNAQVFWRSTARSTPLRPPQMTTAFFFEWLDECFIPMVKIYLRNLGLPQRCKLLVDAEMFHGEQLKYDNSFVHLVLLPERRTHLLQPLAMSVIPVFKCYYFRRVFSYFLSRFRSEIVLKDLESNRRVWQKFTICESIDFIEESLREISNNYWNGGWKRVWGEIVRVPFSDLILEREIQRMFDVKRILGFPERNTNDLYKTVKGMCARFAKMEIEETKIIQHAIAHRLPQEFLEDISMLSFRQ